jgi:hypothetical protein
MKLMARIAGVLMVGLLMTAGCKKEEKPVGAEVQLLDASKLRPAFASAPAEQQAIVDSVMMSIQGSEPVKARAELNRLSKMPGLTDPQQKVVKDLSDQLDKKIAATANPAVPK